MTTKGAGPRGFPACRGAGAWLPEGAEPAEEAEEEEAEAAQRTGASDGTD